VIVGICVLLALGVIGWYLSDSLLGGDPGTSRNAKAQVPGPAAGEGRPASAVAEGKGAPVDRPASNGASSAAGSAAQTASPGPTEGAGATTPMAGGQGAPAAKAEPPAPSVAAVLDRIESAGDPAWQVTVSAEQSRLRIGRDRLRMRIASSRPGYVYVLMAGTDGSHLYMLFPNALDRQNRLGPGLSLSLPQPGWAVMAGGPPGTDRILTLVSDRPRDMTEAGLRPGQPFSEFDVPTLLKAMAAGGVGSVLGTPACPPGEKGPCSGFGAAQLRIEEAADAP